MVKNLEYSVNIFNKLMNLASAEDSELLDLLPSFLNTLVEEAQGDFAYIANHARTEMYSSSQLDLQGPEFQNLLAGAEKGHEFLNLEIGTWGELIIKNPKNKEDEAFWQYCVELLNLLIRNEDVKNRTKLIVALTSEIRNNLKPEVAIEKVYKELSPFLELREFYFFKKREKDDDKFDVFFQRKDGEKAKLNKTISLEEIETLSFIGAEFKTLKFECKLRERLWGYIVVARRKEWIHKDVDVIEPFAEQMATVFSQYELHAESLTMAQREFLLNQITTTIRESLEVEKIITTASQEIAQVLAVEACGITILDRKIRTTLNHAVWSPAEETNKKMTALMKRSINSEYAPTLDNPIIEISDFEGKQDSLANFFSDLLGVKSYLACALRRQDTGEILGILSIAFFNTKRSWTDDEQQLLESIGKQLEMALTQAAIFQESQQTKLQMALLQKLSSNIRESLEISTVLEEIAKGLGEVLGLSRCFVRRFTEEHRILKTEREYVAEGYFPSADIIFDFEEAWIKVLSEGNVGKEDYNFLNIPYVKAKMMADQSPLMHVADAIDLKSYLCVPLVARDKILGTINVHQCDRERNFLPEEIEFVCRVASEASVAIQHAQLFAMIDRMSKTDPDTGLFNKRFFTELAIDAIKYAKEKGKNVSYIILDLDHLKDINDTPGLGGHEAGDEAILLVAKTIENTVRTAPSDEVRTRRSDIVGRFGGDEFMVLLPDTDIDAATSVANRILNNIKKADHSTWPNPLTASIGVAGTPYTDCDYDTLKREADEALYLSKENGRAQVSNSADLKKDK